MEIFRTVVLKVWSGTPRGPQILLGVHNYVVVILTNVTFKILPKEMYQPLEDLHNQ